MDRRSLRWLLLLITIASILIAFGNLENNYLFLIVAIISLFYFIKGFYLKCPECKSWWGAHETSVKILNRRDTFKTITRIDEIRDEDGNKTGTITRKETVPAEEIEMKINYSCKYCGAVWYEIKFYTV